MKLIAGVDEVGRGSLIGPVYAAAVILKKSADLKILKDSKLLSKKKREYLFNYIKKNSIWSLGKASVSEIEKLNILNASLLAMKRAILKLTKKPTLVLIDGNKIPHLKNYKFLIFQKKWTLKWSINSYVQVFHSVAISIIHYSASRLKSIHFLLCR